MRAVLLLLVSLAAMATAKEIADDNISATMDIKEKQTAILKLLNYIMEPLMYKDLEDLGKNFKFEDNIEMFSNIDVVKNFTKMVNIGMLPRGEIFTLSVDRQLKEVVTMFHMLYYAKDFTTFLKTACWMRLYLNEGMFTYALSVAVRHREDCKSIVLPPPYEIYPYFFVRADVIQKAYLLKMKKGLLDMKLCDFYGIKKTDKDVYIIDENYYDTRVYLNEEDQLRYFTEDIDLNTYYYYFHVDYPFWMKDNLFDKFKTRRFELTMYMYQQILARYYLERLSNGLGEVQEFSWYKSINSGYWPWMQMHNGGQFPVRYNNYVIATDKNLDIIGLCEEYERIIKDSILKGFVEVNGMRLEITKYDDMEMLGKLIYSKVDKTDLDKTYIESYRYLLIVMNAALGLNTFESDKYFVASTVLDHYQTALRDPVFYMLQKRIVDLVYLFKLRLPSYTKEDLYFPGVKIDNVVVDKLVTYFDDYLMDMTNAVTLTEEEFKKTKSDMVFMVRKRRLNNEPFKVTLDVISDKVADCVVRIFLGPKYDEFGRVIDINTNRVNFVELDSFSYKLTTGKNTIVRNSYDMHNLVKDRMMTREFLDKIDSIADVKQMLGKDFKNYQTGFPTRLLLPKGLVGGMEMLLYVCVTPLRPVDMSTVANNNKESMVDFRYTVLLDKMPLGFPLDRPIDVSTFFTPNMKFVDVMIFNKKVACDMKTRWNRYVLKDYNMAEKTFMADSYFDNTDLNMKVAS